MPLSFRIPTKLIPRWNEQGKRPRENTVQLEDVIEAFEANPPTECKEDDVDKTATVNARTSKLNLAEMSKIYASRRPSDLMNKEIKTPDQEQRDIIQSVTARVLLLQRPDDMDIPDLIQGDQRQLAFIGSRVPSISFVKYVERLVHNINRWAYETPGESSVGVQSAVLAIEYLEKAEGVKITPKSIHRYFLGAFLAGIKFNFDYYLSANYWAGVGGVRLEELNFLEIQFCSMLNWNLYVNPETYDAQLQKTIAFC